MHKPLPPLPQSLNYLAKVLTLQTNTISLKDIQKESSSGPTFASAEWSIFFCLWLSPLFGVWVEDGSHDRELFNPFVAQKEFIEVSGHPFVLRC